MSSPWCCNCVYTVSVLGRINVSSGGTGWISINVCACLYRSRSISFCWVFPSLSVLPSIASSTDQCILMAEVSPLSKYNNSAARIRPSTSSELGNFFFVSLFNLLVDQEKWLMYGLPNQFGRPSMYSSIPNSHALQHWVGCFERAWGLWAIMS